MFFSTKKSILGVDIGTTNIKIAQITTDTNKNTHFLDTYGLVSVAFEIDERKDTIVEQTVQILQNLIEKAGVTTKKVVASLPNSAVFTSVIEMPPLEDQELKGAVEFEAKKYIPLPMSEMTLSWTPLERQLSGKITVLITAVPNAILRNYLRIFELANLEPLALEIEALALIRSVVGEDKENDMIIDIGAKVTHINIIEKGNLVLTRNIPIGGETITTRISESLKISAARAEQFKKEFGVNQSKLVPETIKPIINTIKSEVRQLQSIYTAHGKKLDKIITVGGGSNLPGVADYLSDIGVKIVNGDPMSRISYNPEIKPFLSQFSSNLAVAIGLALRTAK